jgi:AraC-like DNA-binding protein
MELLVARWEAPFTAASVGEFEVPERARAGASDVLLVRVTQGEPLPVAADEDPVEAVVAGLRRRNPGNPVAVWIPQAPTDFVIDMVRYATASHVRAILGGPAADGERLRVQLTHPQGLSSFVLRWGSDAGYLPKGAMQQEVRALLDAAPNVRTLQRLASDRHEAARTWRSRLQQLGLPNPKAWLGLAHALHVAFYLQRNPRQPLALLARNLGYSDVTLMSHRFQSVFHMPPGEVRSLLGAEPLLQRWFQGGTRDVSR